MEKINKEEENKIIKRNGVYSVLFKGIEYFLAFFTTPLLLGCLGEIKYGIYVSTLSLISWIYYFDLGIGSGMRNKVTEFITLNQNHSARKVINLAFFMISIISVIAFLGCIILSMVLNFDELLNANLSDENLNIIIDIAILLACINFILSLSKNILYAVQEVAYVNGIGIVSKILMIIALWLFVQYEINEMIYVVIAEGVVQFIGNCLGLYHVKKEYKDISPKVEALDYSHSKDILNFGIQIFIMQMAALMLNATDNIIIMKLFSASEVTPYNLCHKFFSMINAFFVAAVAGFWTAYTKAYIVKDVEYIIITFKKAFKLYVGTFILFIIGGYIFEPFMAIYLGKELIYQDGMILLVGGYYAMLVFSHIFSAFVHGISKTKYTTIACFIGMIVNIPCSIYFATDCNMKVNGVMLGSIVSLVITTVVYIYTTYTEIEKIR